MSIENRIVEGSNSGIQGIKLSGAINLTVNFGQTFKLTLDGEQLDLVKTYIDDHTLFIGHESNIIVESKGVHIIGNGNIGNIAGRDIIINGDIVRGATSITNPLTSYIDAVLTISVNQEPIFLEKVKSSGSGNILIENIIGDLLELKVSGSGHIKINGVVQQLIAKVSGSGSIKAKHLTTKLADLKVSGSGSLKTSVIDNVKARVSGSGNITIYGQPPIKDTKTSGSGKIAFKSEQED